MLQRERDRAAGLNTGGFISGYRGSPLGMYDHALWRPKKFLLEHNIAFIPGLNEDLAATAVWGSQHRSLRRAGGNGIFAAGDRRPKSAKRRDLCAETQERPSRWRKTGRKMGLSAVRSSTASFGCEQGLEPGTH
jgi:hypothetical protein